MARRSSSTALAATLCLVAVWAFANTVFVTPPGQAASLRGATTEVSTRFSNAQQAALLGAVLTAPQAAHAASQGYALLQLGWAVFIISLGPAVLFWIYFNKPELL
eukprot:TRINITY_DN41031_c0_g1_i1.p1 TRINITY_DN41031_c0_g1~~TRINITY_DN41031_c0_g1_i1.p1  ORF type:complete len:105 (-),score=18.56 TRINITY_DN41031_c0_g1_i1:67-381(-)